MYIARRSRASPVSVLAGAQSRAGEADPDEEPCQRAPFPIMQPRRESVHDAVFSLRFDSRPSLSNSLSCESRDVRRAITLSRSSERGERRAVVAGKPRMRRWTSGWSFNRCSRFVRRTRLTPNSRASAAWLKPGTLSSLWRHSRARRRHICMAGGRGCFRAARRRDSNSSLSRTSFWPFLAVAIPKENS